jgi:hypothetical protein
MGGERVAEWRWWGWGGAAAGALIADYGDARVHRYSSSLTNGQLAELGLIAVDVFGLVDRFGGDWTQGSDGAGDWAVGALASTFIQRRLTPAAPAPAAPAAAPTTVATAAQPQAGYAGGGRQRRVHREPRLLTRGRPAAGSGPRPSTTTRRGAAPWRTSTP